MHDMHTHRPRSSSLSTFVQCKLLLLFLYILSRYSALFSWLSHFRTKVNMHTQICDHFQHSHSAIIVFVLAALTAFRDDGPVIFYLNLLFLSFFLSIVFGCEFSLYLIFSRSGKKAVGQSVSQSLSPSVELAFLQFVRLVSLFRFKFFFSSFPFVSTKVHISRKE